MLTRITTIPTPCTKIKKRWIKCVSTRNKDNRNIKMQWEVGIYIYIYIAIFFDKTKKARIERQSFQNRERESSSSIV
jgi:hypothetical protein